MKDPANRDFSLADGSAAVDRGVKAFVPWSTYANVGEWNFYPAGNDAARLIDEHWYMTPYYYVRDTYYLNPRFPLTGVNITKDNYVDGPLEDWTKGACTFNGKDQYAVCSNAKLNKSLTIPIKFRWDKSGQKEDQESCRQGFQEPAGLRFEFPDRSLFQDGARPYERRPVPEDQRCGVFADHQSLRRRHVCGQRRRPSGKITQHGRGQ